MCDLGAEVATPKPSQDHPLGALLQQRDIEVDEKTKPALRKPQVREQLSFVHRRDRFNGFHFHYNAVVDNKINSIASF